MQTKESLYLPCLCYYEDNRLMETTDYSGMFVYKDGHVDYIQTSEGRMYWDNNHHLFYAEYFIKDHLGNVRDVITTNPYYSNSIIQITDYYPFGLEIQDINASDNLQLYNSKELQTDAKLWWYDYGARFYDPQLGRWHSVDPMAEKHFGFTPYNYVLDNPIRFIDVMGLDTNIYLFDQANRPADNGTAGTSYTAEVIVEVDGEPTDTYRGSSYPNSKSNSDNTTSFNTINEGEHNYDNKYGHKESSQKGLNIFDNVTTRTTDGTTPNGTIMI